MSSMKGFTTERQYKVSSGGPVPSDSCLYLTCDHTVWVRDNRLDTFSQNKQKHINMCVYIIDQWMLINASYQKADFKKFSISKKENSCQCNIFPSKLRVLFL